jgi:hypothetical protein
MKLSAKLPPGDEAANLMRAGKHLRPTGVRTLPGRWHGRDDGQKGGRAAARCTRRQRVISVGNGYVAARRHVVVACGGGS